MVLMRTQLGRRSALIPGAGLAQLLVAGAQLDCEDEAGTVDDDLDIDTDISAGPPMDAEEEVPGEEEDEGAEDEEEDDEDCEDEGEEGAAGEDEDEDEDEDDSAEDGDEDEMEYHEELAGDGREYQNLPEDYGELCELAAQLRRKVLSLQQSARAKQKRVDYQQLTKETDSRGNPRSPDEMKRLWRSLRR